MHCLDIGSVTLEMDSKLTNLLAELDALDLVDVTDPRSLLRYAAEVYGDAQALHRGGRVKEALELFEEARAVEAIAKEMVKVPQTLFTTDGGVGQYTVSKSLLTAPSTSAKMETLLSPTTAPLSYSVQTMAPVTAVTAPSTSMVTTTPVKTTLAVDASKPLPAPPRVVITVPPVPPVIIEEGQPLPGPQLSASDLDSGLGTVAKVAIGIGVVAAAWWFLKGRKKA